MNISPNAVYQSDCLALLERIEAAQATLIYIDAPSYPLIELPSGFSDFEDPEEVLKKAEANYQEGLNEYLSFLSKVLQQVQRILSQNGSVFIQSTHHLTGHARLLLDQIFGMRNFRGEFIWPNRQRQTKSAQRKTEHDHDTLIRYSKTSSYVDNPQYRTLPGQGSRKLSEYTDSHGTYRLTDITSPLAEPSLQFEWNGSVPSPGRSWRFSKERLDELNRAGMIVHRPRNKLPALKVYMDDGPKVEVGSVWDDIMPVSILSHESVGFPGQKPLALIERVILMGSEPGDLVFDPFCGSGTTFLAAQKNGRRWLGCDLSAEAYARSVKRLEETLNLQHDSDYGCGDQHFLEKNFPVISDLYNLEIGSSGHASRSGTVKYILHQPLDADETRHCEYKEIKGSNPIDAIKNTVDEYAVAFLKQRGRKHILGHT